MDSIISGLIIGGVVAAALRLIVFIYEVLRSAYFTIAACSFDGNSGWAAAGRKAHKGILCFSECLGVSIKK
jgi:hypothetical protein